MRHNMQDIKRCAGFFHNLAVITFLDLACHGVSFSLYESGADNFLLLGSPDRHIGCLGRSNFFDLSPLRFDGKGGELSTRACSEALEPNRIQGSAAQTATSAA